MIEEGSTNVYADLGFSNADEMLEKAELATRIRNLITANKWTKREACKILELSQAELSDLLNGKFRRIARAKMLDRLTRMG